MIKLNDPYIEYVIDSMKHIFVRLQKDNELKNIESSNIFELKFQKILPNRLNEFLSLIKLMRLTLAFFIASVLEYGDLNLITQKKVCIGKTVEACPMQTSSNNLGRFLVT